MINPGIKDSLAQLSEKSYSSLTGRPTIPTTTGDEVIPVVSGLAKITVGTVQPSTPTTGDLWVDTN